MAVDKKDSPEAERAAEALSGWAFVGTLVSWVMLLLGLRVVDTQEGLAKFLTGLGVVLLVACFGQRIWLLTESRGGRRPAALGLSIAAALGLIGLAVYAGNSEWGRPQLGLALADGSKADRMGDIATVLWVSLIALSVVPTVLGELARRSMLRADRVESGRVVAAMVAGAAVSLAAVYGSLFTYAATQTKTSIDYSYFRVAAPSESTARMVASLEQPMKVLAFFSSHSKVRPKVVAYLQDLKQRAGNLDIEVHDMMLSPKLAKEHKVRRDGVIVLVRDKKSETIDIGDKIARASRKLRKLDGEFQKALIKARRSKRTAYLTVGHGEINEVNDAKSGRTVRGMRKLLEYQHYAIKNLGAAEGLGNEVPQDADVVIVMGPTERFSDAEVAALKQYTDRGGKLFLALDADAKVDLSGLAAVVGLSWKPALVLNDKVMVRAKRNKSDRKILVAKRFSSHASVSTLSKNSARGAAVLFGGSAGLDKLAGGDKALRIDFTVKSPAGSYLDENDNFRFDAQPAEGDAKEKKATYNLGAAVWRPSASKDKKDGQPEMRAFVLGDADMLSDRYIDFMKANRLLFVEAVRWLGGEESFSGQLSEEEDVRIVHTKAEDQAWFYTAVLGVPSLLLGFGLFSTRRRRRKLAERKRSAAAAVKAPAVDDEAEAEVDSEQRSAIEDAETCDDEPDDDVAKAADSEESEEAAEGDEQDDDEEDPS